MKLKSMMWANLVASSAFVSCQKEKMQEQIPEKQKINSTISGVSLDPSGYLSFVNEDAYDQALHTIAKMSDQQFAQYAQQLGYVSSFSTYYDAAADTFKALSGTDKNLSKEMDDDLLHKVINKNGLIKIEQTIYRMVADSNYVLTMHESKKTQHLNALINAQFNPAVMNKLNNESIPENSSVFEFVKAYPAGKTLGTMGLFQNREIEIVPVPVAPNSPGSGLDGIQFRIKVTATKYKAVFYYSVLGKGEYQTRTSSSGIWWGHSTNMSVHFPYVNTYCLAFRVTGTPEHHLYPGTSETSVTHSSSKKWRPYEGSKKIRNGFFRITISYEDEYGINQLAESPELNLGS